MDNFESINSNLEQYRLAEVNINCKEITQEDNLMLSDINLPVIKFAAGLGRNFSNFGFLEFNSKPTRVTIDGFYILNILIPEGNYELKTFRNNDLINTETLPVDTKGPIARKILFDEYFQGDQIIYKLDIAGESNENAPTKIFNIFPSQLFSNVIVWENEFLLQSTLECTHDLDIKGEIERQSSKRYNGFVEKTVHFSSSKDDKLSINTGWVSRYDIDSIESLLLSKRAFLNLSGKIIDLVPISKALTSRDTNQELFAYTLEFTINRIYNEETYSS